MNKSSFSSLHLSLTPLYLAHPKANLYNTHKERMKEGDNTRTLLENPPFSYVIVVTHSKSVSILVCKDVF
jgi:hypothetical protein